MIYDSQQSTLTTLPATELTPQVHWKKYILVTKNIYKKNTNNYKCILEIIQKKNNVNI